MKGPKSKVQSPKFARSYRSWAAIRDLVQDSVRGVNHVGVFAVDDSKRLVVRKFSPEVAAERLGAVPVDYAHQDIAMDVVIPERFGAEDVVGVELHGSAITEPVDFAKPIPLIDMEEHDPAGGRKQQRQFGKLAMEQGNEVIGPKRFVMEDQHPAKDKPRDG